MLNLVAGDDSFMWKTKSNVRGIPFVDIYQQIPRGMQEYIQFHHSQVQNPILDANHPNRTKYIIFRCLMNDTCGGTGDRLRALSTLLNIAMLTRRVLAIQVEKPYPLSETFGNGMLDWQTPLSHLKEIGRERTTLVAIPRISTQDLLEKAQSADAVFIVTNRDDKDYLWKHGLKKVYNMDTFPPQFLEITKAGGISTAILFTPLPSTVRYLNEFCALIGLDLARPFVAIHFRAGGFLMKLKDKQLQRLADVKKFARAALRMGRHLHNPQYFLAADNTVAKKQFKELIPDLKYMAGEVLHVDGTMHQTPEIMEAYMQVWADWMVLARSTCMVASTSGFSRSAKMSSLKFGGKNDCYVRYWRSGH